MPEPIARIALVTDFGEGIYVGQLRARLDALLPGVPVIDLVHDLTPFRPDLAAWLLPALVRDLPPDTLCLCVVDPEVGGSRGGLVARAGAHWFVAPDNGLLGPLLNARPDPAAWRLGWRPERLSASFHGRDWFAPAAARLCRGEDLALTPLALAPTAGEPSPVGHDWPLETATVVYRDRFGNLMTGLRPPAAASAMPRLRVGAVAVPHARTFCEVRPGAPFWYENALGLVELAVNRGRADQVLGLAPGDPLGPWLTD